MVAATLMGMGDRFYGLGGYDQAIRNYEQASEMYANLNKKREFGHACFALGLAHARKENREIAVKLFNQAMEMYEKLKLPAKINEVKFELTKLFMPDGYTSGSIDQILEANDQIQVAKEKRYEVLLREVGEYTLHDWIKRNVRCDVLPELGTVLIGIGDDAAVIRPAAPGQYDVVVTTDAAPGSICRKPEVESGEYAAKFSVVHSLSDLLAMGASPFAVLLNLYLPHDVSLKYAIRVIQTVQAEAQLYGAALIGGDVKERKERSIGCVGIGLVPRNPGAIRRTGAEPGQIVAITLARLPDQLRPKLGGSSIRKLGIRWAQEIIRRSGLGDEEPYRHFNETNWLKDLLYLSKAEVLAGAATGKIRSAIDTSDGFLSCLQILGHESTHKQGIGFVLDEARIEEYIADEVKKIARAMNLRPAQFLFNAGHDWEIVLTANPDEFNDVRAAVQSAGGDLAPLGVVVSRGNQGRGDLARGVAVRSKPTAEDVESPVSWIPFFTDEKFVRHSYEDRPVDWEDLSAFLEGQQSFPADVAGILASELDAALDHIGPDEP